MKFPSAFYRWRPHPWHGLEVGPNPPSLVYAFIEITPFDVIKYELDKTTGYLRVDRPQRTSSQPPSLYGFIPRTYCGDRVGALSPNAKTGDGDPLDICVLSERPIEHSEVILTARVVGAIRTVDNGLADDKILAVLQNDAIWGQAQDVGDLPAALIDRLRHYFGTYKMIPGKEDQNQMVVEEVLNCAEAYKVIDAAIQDYADVYGQ
jgi:inorganic pyrophosphatase